ncbi:hypothetical protein PISMIDRAFT_114211, partial [Pisolithus microcarpus 441]
LKWIHLNQHARYTCMFCGKVSNCSVTVSIKHVVVRTWRHCSCRKSVAGGGYTVTMTTAATIMQSGSCQV